ncbi:MAG TPA: hypothetical protein VG324_19780 [Blastocatellia bacterium]|nr:hypothetical protein [Blastocatellia bacterium]
MSFEEKGAMEQKKREKFIKRFIDPMLKHDVAVKLLVGVNGGPHAVKIAWGNDQFGFTGTVALDRPEALGGKGSDAVIFIDEAASDWKNLKTIAENPDVGLFHELVHARHIQQGTVVDDEREMERRVIGIGKYTKAKGTENHYRDVRDLPLRCCWEKETLEGVLAGRALGDSPSTIPTNCSAISADRFDKQPAELQRVLVKSFKDPAGWFGKLDPESRIALTSIFNRMCRYGLWPHVRLVLKIDAGEAPVLIADRVFNVPGRTPSVYFMSSAGQALIDALMATGRFCMARGVGASQHPGQTTLREISGSDSLHISVGPGDRFDAHIDKFSPVTEHPGSSFCSNRPSVAALTHIGRELVPEWVRKKTGIPGVQVFPEQTFPQPGPPPPRQEADIPPIVGVTWRGPRARTRPRPSRDASPLLPVEVVTRIDRAIKEQVSPAALLPSHVRARLARTRWAAETAGPNEEAAARVARDAAEREASNYPDAQEFALDLAERMEQARRSRVAWVKIDFPQYGSGDFGSRKAIAGEIRRIALILRNHLPDGAKDLRAIVIIFGSGNFATREEVRLP